MSRVVGWNALTVCDSEWNLFYTGGNKDSSALYTCVKMQLMNEPLMLKPEWSR